MLGATHTRVLMEVTRLSGLAPQKLGNPGGLIMTFGNLLPDALPLVGISPETAHDMNRARMVTAAAPALGKGITIHIYTDNLTHCDNLENDGNYGASVALKLGLELMDKTSGRFHELLESLSGPSTAYMLHTVIEFAADVITARGEVVELIEKAWKFAENNHTGMIDSIAEIYCADPRALAEGMGKFPPENRPEPEAIYSRPARADLFLRKFGGKNYSNDETRRRHAHSRVLEMLEAAETMLHGSLDELVENFARRIVSGKPAVARKLGEIIESVKN